MMIMIMMIEQHRWPDVSESKGSHIPPAMDISLSSRKPGLYYHYFYSYI
jgi:hypothetical protein